MREKSRFASIGGVPHSFGSAAAVIGAWRDIGLDELTSGEARTLRILAVGECADLSRIARLVPTLRATNPALVLVSLIPVAASNLSQLMDDTLTSDSDYRRFVDHWLAAERSHSGASSWVSAGRQAARRVLPLLTVLLVWEVAVQVLRPAPYLLPAPSSVLRSFLSQPDRFLMHTLVTAFEALAGFVIGNTLGIAVAVLLARYVRLHSFTMPILVSLQAIPVVAFAPLLAVWLGTGYAAKIGMAALICFFPIVVNTLQAFASVDPDFLELFRIYRAKFSTTLRRLLVPASAPSVVAALRISAGLAVVGAIVAEMTGADRGLGYLILNGAYRLETDVLFVAMLLSGVLGVMFYALPELVRPLLPRSWQVGT